MLGSAEAISLSVASRNLTICDWINRFGMSFAPIGMFVIELRNAGLPVSLTENLDAMEAVQERAGVLTDRLWARDGV